MAEASKTVEMNIPREKLWSVITKYEEYPQFVEGAQTVKILSRKNGVVRIEYGIHLLGKEIIYVLDHYEDKIPDRLHWEFVESNILKANFGEWILNDLGGVKTEVTYTLAMEFKIYVPGMILSGLVKSSLPKMLDSFKNRALSV